MRAMAMKQPWYRILISMCHDSHFATCALRCGLVAACAEHVDRARHFYRKSYSGLCGCAPLLVQLATKSLQIGGSSSVASLLISAIMISPWPALTYLHGYSPYPGREVTLGR